jgi:hypothetical protein
MAGLAWALVVWAGGHGGYYSIPGIASKENCEETWMMVKTAGFYAPAMTGLDHACLPYTPWVPVQ